MTLRAFRCSTVLPLVGLLCMAIVSTTIGGAHNIFSNRAVGGVSITADGVLHVPAESDFRILRDEIRKSVGKPAAELNQPVEMRMISLKALEAMIDDARRNGVGALPDEARYLAGIQRIQYVLIYPEQNDIVLAGPGEGWKVDENGNIVGVTTGLPVIRLEDLAVAFRTVEEARKGGITCSIDPTQEGIKQFQQLSSSIQRMAPGVVEALEKAMGPQEISVTGVPDDTHFARVLVASDYRMKRYAMDLDKAPVQGLPSFIGMLKSKKGSLTSAIPRWWLACNYEPLAKSEDGLAYELRGPGVKVMTEDDFAGGDGAVKRSGKSSPVAQQWADTLTEKYEALAAKDPIFGELRNLMDLCVVAALIHREHLLDKVSLQIPNIASTKEGMELDKFNSPKKVSTRCSVTKSGREFVITASGGVEINSWAVAENVKTDPAVSKAREKATSKDAKALWWN